MDLAPIVERLRDQVPSLRQVAGAGDFATLPEAGPVVSPSAWVLALAERAGPNALTSAISQRVELQVGVVLAVRNVSDARGEAAGADLDVLRSVVRAALLGYTPEGATDPLEARSGGLIRIVAGWLWWQDQYATAYYIRST